MKKSLIFILGFILIAITSCEYKIVEPVIVELPDEPASFATDIIPIFENNCAVCHGSRSPVLTDGKEYKSLIDGNYINTADPESSILYLKLNGSTSHVVADPEDLAYILKWITEGAENN